MVYAIIAGLIVAGVVIVLLVIKWYGSSQKSIGTMAQVTKDQDLDLKVIVAQRDAIITQHTDPSKPDDILGKL